MINPKVMIQRSLAGESVTNILEGSGRTFCFYHSADLDGHCSGAIVKHNHPECELIGINYQDKFPWDKIEDGDKVFMVDFSIDSKDMKKLNDLADFVWIDHHTTSIEANKGTKFEGIQQVGKAACELCAEYFEMNVVDGIKLLSTYDVWNDEDKEYWESKVLPFHYGMMKNEDTRPENSDELWNEVFEGYSDFIEDTIKDGKIILAYENAQNAAYMRAYGFEAEIAGKKVLVANRGMTGSQLFESMWDPGKFEMMVTFCKGKDGWKVGLYTTREDVDCGAIAKSLGGGGHRQAAGYSTKQCPF